jgi:RND family efflux transporter MFP subunit
VDRIGVQENATTRSTRTQALIDQARARVDRARAAVAEGSIIAPFAGVVGSILFEAGEHVNSGETVLTLIGEGTYDIILDVPEIDIGKIIVGNDITASLDAYPDISWAGHITTISPSERYIDGVPVYSVTAVINNPDDRIRSGMSGRVFIETRRVSNVLAVPVSALTFKDKEVFVDTVQDGESITTPVMLGFRGSDGMVEVKEGLQEGDMIVVSDTKSSSP